MSDVFPRRNLPDEAEPWGREHDKRVLSLESNVESIQRGLQGQNRNTASSLSNLGDQIRDLAGRVAYTTEGYDFQSWTSTQADNYAFGDSVTFTLTERRRISIQFAVDVSATAVVNNTSSTSTAFINAGIQVNGSVIVSQTMNGVSSSVSGAAGRAASQSASTSSTAIARVLVDLGPGTHSARGVLRQRRVNLSGAATGLINVSGYQVFVDVLQPT